MNINTLLTKAAIVALAFSNSALASQFPPGTYAKGVDTQSSCPQGLGHPNFEAAYACVVEGLDPGTYTVTGVQTVSPTQWNVTFSYEGGSGGATIAVTPGPIPPDPKRETGGPSCCVANPINPATGNKYQVELDYRAAGSPLPLEFRRFYSSDVPRNGDLGYQWTHNYSSSVSVTSLTGYTVARVTRPDGKVFNFYEDASGGWDADYPDVTATFERFGAGWKYTDENDIVETFDANGRLTDRQHRSGFNHHLTYHPTTGKLATVADSFGRSLTLTYVSGRLDALTLPGSLQVQYDYDAAGNLWKVTYPDENPNGAVRQYHYDEVAFPHALTGITDENADLFATWDYDAQGRAFYSTHAGGADAVTLTFNAGGTTMVDSLGKTRQFVFENVYGVRRIDTLDAPFAGSANAAYEYADNTGFIESATDFNGNVTTYLRPNPRGLEESRTEASGTSIARTITTEWHASFRLPAEIEEPGRRTVYGHDATGDRESETITDLATLESRTTTWTYNSFGQVLTVNGPRTDVTDVTTYTYYNCSTGVECGQIHTITNALGQVTELTNYDAHGNPLTIEDPNGVVTTLTYDPRQRLKTRSVAGATTTFEYDDAGLLDKVTLPGGAFLDYTYDDAHRLTDIEDNLGNLIHYVLNTNGNRTREDVRDPAGVLKGRNRWVFNNLGQLNQIKNAANVITTDYGYDAQGNRTSQLDYSTPTTSHLTTFAPDALNRTKQTTDALSGVTEYGYNALDQLTSVEDPKGLTTSYTLNALGDLKQQVSPDTGTTQYPIYDAAGNRKRQIDARGVQVDYTYDALNRLTFVNYPATSEDVTYTYDSTQVSNGKGRLTGIVDQSGSTTLHYDARGNVSQEARVIGGTNYVTGYGYDSADRLTSITYPSGRVVTYVRDSAGRIDQVKTTVSGVETTLASAVDYMPFGGISSYQLANGVTVARSHDLDYRVDGITDQGASMVQDINLYYDLRDNVEATEDLVSAGRSQTFDYDSLSRLGSGAGLYGARGYTYDGVGNRLTQTITPPGGSPQTYTYPAGNHRLTSISGGSAFTYDNAGNTSTKGSLTLTYNSAGRASSIGSVGNTYNGAGQRIKKTVGGQTTIFHYDRQGHLLAENITPGTTLEREYVWLEDLPLVLDSRNPYSEVIVDNTDAGFTTTGTWATSTAVAGYYGSNYRTGQAAYEQDDAMAGVTKTLTWTTGSHPYAFGGSFQKSSSSGAPPGPTFTWPLQALDPGQYRVYVRWVSIPCSATTALYTITHSGGTSDYVRNQDSGGGVWNLAGTFTFGASGRVTLKKYASFATTCLIADAVRWEQVNPTGSAQWAAPAPTTYEVFARWPASSTHSATAEYRVTHDGGTAIVTKNQQTGGGTFTSLGTFTFNNTAGQGVKLVTTLSGAVAADAVKFTPPARLVSYYHTDHLGTPQKLTDSSQQVVWDGSYEPFGTTTLLANTITQPLRFPGQYFDAETGLHQNWMRDYDPSIGRYVQSDPIGLLGGLNTYAYVGGNPLRYKDPRGLDLVDCAFGMCGATDKIPNEPAPPEGPETFAGCMTECELFTVSVLCQPMAGGFGLMEGPWTAVAVNFTCRLALVPVCSSRCDSAVSASQAEWSLFNQIMACDY